MILLDYPSGEQHYKDKCEGSPQSQSWLLDARSLFIDSCFPTFTPHTVAPIGGQKIQGKLGGNIITLRIPYPVILLSIALAFLLSL